MKQGSSAHIIFKALIAFDLISATLLVPLLSPGTAWPFLHWHLYIATAQELPERYTTVQIRVDSEATPIIHTYDLYTNDDISSVQPLGKIVLNEAIRSPDRIQSHLSDRIRAIAPDATTATIEECFWTVNYNWREGSLMETACRTLGTVDLSEGQP